MFFLAEAAEVNDENSPGKKKKIPLELLSIAPPPPIFFIYP